MSLDLPLFNAAESRAARDHGMALSVMYSNDGWLERARSVAELICATEGECTIENIYKRIGMPEKRNLAGSVFKGKRFRCIGIDEATRVERHSGVIRRWVLNA